MCTVSIIQSPSRLRLVVNRDEQRSRPLAQPPTIIELAAAGRPGRVHALMPIDPASGGTWVAVNDAGLAIALLNVSRGQAGRGQAVKRERAGSGQTSWGQAVNRESAQTPPGAPPRSRGDIVPRLAAFTTLEPMVAAARAIDRTRYQPFRLVCAGPGRAVLVDPHLDLIEEISVVDPLMFTSSGLGDDLVEGPRRALFAELVRDAPAGELASRQDRFHAHRWESMPHVSVLMTRHDASTVSRTVVEIEPGRLRMIYAAAPGWHTSAVEMPREPDARQTQREDSSR